VKLPGGPLSVEFRKRLAFACVPGWLAGTAAQFLAFSVILTIPFFEMGSFDGFLTTWLGMFAVAMAFSAPVLLAGMMLMFLSGRYAILHPKAFSVTIPIASVAIPIVTMALVFSVPLSSYLSGAVFFIPGIVAAIIVARRTMAHLSQDMEQQL
jgi:hypothetical protein